MIDYRTSNANAASVETTMFMYWCKTRRLIFQIF